VALRRQLRVSGVSQRVDLEATHLYACQDEALPGLWAFGHPDVRAWDQARSRKTKRVVCYVWHRCGERALQAKEILARRKV